MTFIHSKIRGFKNWSKSYMSYGIDFYYLLCYQDDFYPL